MTFRIFTILITIVMYGCSVNPSLNELFAGRGGGMADVKVGEFDHAPAKTAPMIPDKPVAGTGAGKYDFSMEEVQFKESSFLANGTQAPSIRIVARNKGYAPVSVTVTYDHDLSENMKYVGNNSYTSVVPPHSEKVIARFDPTNNHTNWKLAWHYSWEIGDYTARHVCRERYRYPFPNDAAAYPAVPEEQGSTPYTRNAAIFSMPAGTRVLAARKGTVVRINEKNDVDILHDDSTIATYGNLGEIAREIRVGKAVEAGEAIGIAVATAGQAYIQLAVWRPEPYATGSLPGQDRPGYQAVSFPLEFNTPLPQRTAYRLSEPVTSHAAPSVAANESAAGKAEKPAASQKKGEYDFYLRDDHSAEPFITPDGPAASRIVAVNSGYSPVSVIFDLNPGSENIRPDVSLPFVDVIFPHSEKVLARLLPVVVGKRMGYSFRYVWQLGDLTTRHQCPERYRFPFDGNVAAAAQVPDARQSDPYVRHSVQFSLPVNSKVLAARGGVVVRVKDNRDLDILHNDSTIATYNHLDKVEKGICPGKSVLAGDVLGVAGRSGEPGRAYIQITVWQPERASSASLLKSAPANFQPISFPLEFCSGSEDCRVLTHNQRITAKSPVRKRKN